MKVVDNVILWNLVALVISVIGLFIAIAMNSVFWTSFCGLMISFSLIWIILALHAS